MGYSINKRHQAFIAEYLANNFNAVQSYMKIYNVSDYKVAIAASSRLLSNVSIKAEIKKQLDDCLGQERKDQLTKQVIDKYYEFAFLSSTTHEANKLRALEGLSRYLGLNKETRENINKNLDEVKKLFDAL